MTDLRPQEINRPLIFLAHSLGGIVVKQVCQPVVGADPLTFDLS